MRAKCQSMFESLVSSDFVCFSPIIRGIKIPILCTFQDLGFFGTHRESDWDEQDKKTMQDLIWNAAEICFLPLRRYGDDQIFGDIKLYKYDKDEGDMAKELAKNGRAEVVEETIPTGR